MTHFLLQSGMGGSEPHPLVNTDSMEFQISSEDSKETKWWVVKVYVNHCGQAVLASSAGDLVKHIH